MKSDLQRAGTSLRLLVERIPAILWTTDRELRFLSSRGAGLKALGLQPDEIVGLTVYEYFESDDHDHPDIRAHRRAVEGASVAWEARVAGHVYQAYAEPLRNDTGEIQGVTGVALDITARKHAEDVAIQFFNLSLDMLCIVGTDGCFKRVNPQFEHTLGHSPDELTGRPFVDFVYPDDRDVTQAAVQRLARDGRVAEFLNRYRCRDGTYRWLEWRAIPLSEEELICAAARDVTDQRALEEERSSEVERVRRQQAAIVDLAKSPLLAAGDFVEAARSAAPTIATAIDVEAVGIWLLSPDRETATCVERYALSEETHGSGETMLTAGFPRYFDALATDRAIDAEHAASDPRTAELAPIHFDRRGVTSTLSAAIRVRGETVGVVSYEHVGPPRRWHTDEVAFAGQVADQLAQALLNTERLRAKEERHILEAQVQQAQKLESLGVLAGGIAHDFNNLLTAILGNADLALAEVPQSSGVRGYLKDIESSSRRAADLCKQMLAYSGKGQFMMEALDLSEVVKQMTPVLEVSVARHVTLAYDYADDVPEIEADRAQLRQVVMALVMNASEAMGDDAGTVTLRVGGQDCDRAFLRSTYLDDHLPEGRYACLEVIDDGCGMDDDTRARVFEPFFTTKFTGRGLGMAALLGIVRGHDGAVKVESTPGEGSRVVVLLPASSKVSRGHPGRDDDGTRWRGEGTVLLVDDEEAVRSLARRMLEKMGFEVLVAEDGVKALEVFRARQHDIVLVLLDLTMPRLDGEGCFRELRRISDDVRIVLSSGYDQRDVTGRFANEGLAGFVQKPYKRATLQRELRRVLQD